MNEITTTVDDASRALGSDEKTRAQDRKAIATLQTSVGATSKKLGLATQFIASSFEVSGGNVTYFIEMDVRPGSDGVSTTQSVVSSALKHVILGSDGRVAVCDSVTYNDKKNSFHCRFRIPPCTRVQPRSQTKNAERQRGPKTSIGKRKYESARTKLLDAEAELEAKEAAEDGDASEISEQTMADFVSEIEKSSTTSGAASSTGQWWNPLNWIRSKEEVLTKRDEKTVAAFRYKPNLFSFTVK